MLVNGTKWTLTLLFLLLSLACSKETNTPKGSPGTEPESAVQEIQTLNDASTSADVLPEPAALPAHDLASPEMAESDVFKTVRYRVKKGDSLWTIAAKLDIYGDALSWPLIYRNNVALLNDPDLIKPGMVLEIKHGFSDMEVFKAQQHAKKRGAWKLGQQEMSDVLYLSS